MVYNIAWDESTPVGATTPSNTIDSEFQNLKEAISERITDVIPDWDDDGVDPKVLSLPNQDRALVSLTANETIANVSATAIPWDTENEDIGGLVDLGTNATRITIQENGVYLFMGWVAWDPGATGHREVYVRRAGTVRLGSQSTPAIASKILYQSVTCLEVAAASTYYELVVYHEQASGLDIRGGASDTRFACIKVL